MNKSIIALFLLVVSSTAFGADCRILTKAIKFPQTPPYVRLLHPNIEKPVVIHRITQHKKSLRPIGVLCVVASCISTAQLLFAQHLPPGFVPGVEQAGLAMLGAYLVFKKDGSAFESADLTQIDWLKKFAYDSEGSQIHLVTDGPDEAIKDLMRLGFRVEED